MMTNFDYVQNTIDVFEDSLGTDSPIVNACALADRIGYSVHHLGRLFRSLCGESLGRYMQKRRLSEAASLLVEGALTATEAAARFGWEDYSAFSRAMRKEFGTSPGNLSAMPANDLGLTFRARPRLPDALYQDKLMPELVRTDALHVTGMVFFMGPNEKTFHRVWRIYGSHEEKISGRKGSGSFQFSSWLPDMNGLEIGIWILCAVETDPDAVQDPVFFSRSIPPSQVLRFRHAGPVEHLYETYRRIWDEYLPASTFRLVGNWEYQYYPENVLPGMIEICLPVQGE